MSLLKKTKFYSLDKIKKYDATYNIIFGQRSNGKTTAVLLEGIKNYFNDSSQMGIIRRWDMDLIGARASQVFESDIIKETIIKLSGNKYQGVLYKSRKWYMCSYDDEGKAIPCETPFAFAFALSQMTHDKSISYPGIKLILFDEFLERGGKYLVDEFTIFMNTLSTIIRNRTDVVIYMCGNSVTRFAPYWVEMGIHIEKQKQGTIDLYVYGEGKLTVAVEYTADNNVTSKTNEKYFAFDNSPKLKMITQGSWEFDLYPHLQENMKYKPKDILNHFFIDFNNELYQCEVVNLDDLYFIHIHRKTTPLKDKDNDLIYSLEYDPRPNHLRRLNKPINQLTARIWTLFEREKVYFQDNAVGDAITSYLNQIIRK